MDVVTRTRNPHEKRGICDVVHTVSADCLSTVIRITVNAAMGTGIVGSNIIAQSAAITALQAGESCVEEMRREYARRRQFLLDAFAQIPEISCVAPAGTFYIYPNISGTGLSGTEFADKFLMEAGVATVPGTAFDSFCNSHIRLSYASSMESLQTAVSRLKGMLKK